ncbi:MAG: DUF1799 domain-containing protein [Negativicutes bacterium]
MPGNYAVWDLWRKTYTQWRATEMGVVGLDYGAVKIVADACGYELTATLLKKIQILEQSELEKIAKK